MLVLQNSVRQLACLTLVVNVCAVSAAQAGEVAPSAKEPVLDEKAVSWKVDTISPVTDPILFEDAVIRTEFKPVFGYQNISDDFFTGGGDLQVYGIQLRYAVTDRFALLGVKGGYAVFDPELGVDAEGWCDIGVGFKFSLIDDEENQFLLTPGVIFEFASGDEAIANGSGDGVWNLFISSQKGFGKFHLQSNVGLLLPNDGDAKSTILHYHLQADYYLCKWFIPFVVANGYSVVSEGKAVPLGSEGYDLINYGSSGSDGVTQATVGAGFRTRFSKNLDFGFSYEKAVVKPEGLLDDRYTVDFVIRF